MGLSIVGSETLAKNFSSYTRLEGKPRLFFKQLEGFKPTEKAKLRLAPLAEDLIELAQNKFTLPTAERCDRIMRRNGLNATIARDQALSEPYLNDNNKILLERLEEIFPIPLFGSNEKLEKMLVYLEDINHAPYNDKEAFLTRFIEDVKQVEKMPDNCGNNLFPGGNCARLHTIKAFLDAKYNNPERYQELTDLYKLYRAEEVPEYLLYALFPKARFHQLPKQDMEKLLRGENYFPQFSESVGKAELSSLPRGEVFQKGNKMYVRTKAGYEELKMDEETYRTLFPPVVRYAIAQRSNVKNCGKIAILNAIIKHPETRVQLYRMFEQTSTGMLVKIPELEPRHFQRGNSDVLENPKNLHGGLGHKMLECANDFFRLGELDISGGTRPNLVKTLTGHSHNPELAEIYVYFNEDANRIAMERAAKSHQSGIYVFNGWGEYPNLGVYDNHYFSANKMPYKTGTFQNPWNGLEEMPYKDDFLPNCYDGILADVK